MGSIVGLEQYEWMYPKLRSLIRQLTWKTFPHRDIEDVWQFIQIGLWNAGVGPEDEPSGYINQIIQNKIVSYRREVGDFPLPIDPFFLDSFEKNV